MSRETDREAQRVFDSLEGLDLTRRMDLLREETYEGYEVPCSARLAGRVMKRLGIQAEDHTVLWTKLAGRSVAHVYRLMMAALESKEEERISMLTDFAKRRPMLAGAEEHFPEGVFEEAG